LLYVVAALDPDGCLGGHEDKAIFPQDEEIAAVDRLPFVHSG
jgi:hypothetical protein